MQFVVQFRSLPRRYLVHIFCGHLTQDTLQIGALALRGRTECDIGKKPILV
jgi:hypothetical protein